MKVLITGGAGFIGSHTADALLRAGHTVRILDRMDGQVHGEGCTSFPSYLDGRIESIRGDVRNPEDVRWALEGVNAVCHLAALTGVGQSMYDLRAYVDTNCGGTATLLEAIIKRKKPIERLVLASSRAVYGEGAYRCPAHGTTHSSLRRPEDLREGKFAVPCPTCSAPMHSVPTPEHHPSMPLSLYAWTKQQQEDQCRYAARTFGLPVTILRYFNVYGSRQSLRNPYTGIMTVFVNRLRGNGSISLYERGLPVRDFVHVTDVAKANVLALERPSPSGACFNVGTGEKHTVREVATLLARTLGIEPTFRDEGEFRVGDVHACYADIETARKELGYAPRTALSEGLREFVAWAESQRQEDRYAQTVAELERYGLFGRASTAVAQS